MKFKSLALTNAGSYISLQGCHRDKGKIERKKNCQEFKKIKIIIFNQILRVFIPQQVDISYKFNKTFESIWYLGKRV